ncbi:hypothetical protein EON82_25965, partial [bacterium]
RFTPIAGSTKTGTAPILSSANVATAKATPVAMVGVPRAFVLRAVAREAFATVRVAFAAEGFVPFAPRVEDALGPAEPRAGDDARFPAVDVGSGDLAGLVFTSGSTGVPKGVEWTHGNLEGQRAVYRELFAFGEGMTDLVTFPVFMIPALARWAVLKRAAVMRERRTKGRVSM